MKKKKKKRINVPGTMFRTLFLYSSGKHETETNKQNAEREKERDLENSVTF